jgi:predicted nucleic acid-binding protein
VLRQAAVLRATIPSLRTPDAIHAATALLGNCDMFLTNDPGFRRVPGLPLILLSNVLQS